ncbi:hypothetical protein [Catenuloplanes japonicus]|uniref:hypothetical protein n=1 Tax=Catenuloplanes japonicus TaxID=33876 RepID=UPI0018DE9C29|nr:hypothetical protein [Catenuloplanes japonicus]
MTVGPHPPAVYWRRRAVVIGVLLVVVMVIVYSCANRGGDGSPNGQAATGSPTPGADGTPTPQSTATVLTPQTNPPGQDKSFEPAPEGGSANLPASETSLFPTAGADGIVVGGGGCAQGAISITGVTDKTKTQRGTELRFQLKVKNSSTASCTVDVGSKEQEMYLKKGAETVWSSDICSDPGVSNMRTFAAGEETIIGTAVWNGKDSSKCDGGWPAGVAPEAGSYQFFGRLSRQITTAITIELS